LEEGVKSVERDFMVFRIANRVIVHQLRCAILVQVLVFVHLESLEKNVMSASLSLMDLMHLSVAMNVIAHHLVLKMEIFNVI
jgi:hypothetical protein